MVRIFLAKGHCCFAADRGRPGRRRGLSGRVLRSYVFGVQSYDGPTYFAASALLLLAGFTAIFWAARRAAATDPVSALNAG